MNAPAVKADEASVETWLDRLTRLAKAKDYAGAVALLNAPAESPPAPEHERLAAALRQLAAAEPFFAIAEAVTTPGHPNYREWFDEAGGHCVAFSFAGSVITLGDLRKAALARSGNPDGIQERKGETCPNGKARLIAPVDKLDHII